VSWKGLVDYTFLRENGKDYGVITVLPSELSPQTASTSRVGASMIPLKPIGGLLRLGLVAVALLAGRDPGGLLARKNSWVRSRVGRM
jgi:hypothetical protein